MHFLRQLIRNAVETFPIDRKKKEVLLNKLLRNTNKRGAEK